MILRYLYRNKTLIISTLFGLLLALTILNLFKDGILSWARIEKNKELFGVLTSVLNTIFLIIAGVLAYVKFFKGQLFAHQLAATITVDNIAVPNASKQVHGIAIQLKNIGSVRIWNPMVSMEISDYSPINLNYPKIERVSHWDNWSHKPSSYKAQLLVDPGEEILFFHTRFVDNEYFMSSYLVEVKSKDGYIWNFVRNVNNVLTK